MAQQKQRKISTFGSQLTSVVSVALVLLVLGVIAIGGVTARQISHSIKESMGLVVEIRPESSSEEVESFRKELRESDFAASAVYTTSAEILKEESAQFGDDILELLEGSNPYSDEIEIKMREDYANSDSMKMVAEKLKVYAVVDRVNLHTGIIDNVNTSLRKISFILAAVGVILLIISFVLINNTVSLSIYSRRFIIHTMRLVGAKASFIRKPFVMAGVGNGLLAGLLASALLAGAYLYISSEAPVLEELIGWPELSGVMVAMVLVGIGLCALASGVAASRFLRLGYDKLFK